MSRVFKKTIHVTEWKKIEDYCLKNGFKGNKLNYKLEDDKYYNDFLLQTNLDERTFISRKITHLGFWEGKAMCQASLCIYIYPDYINGDIANSVQILRNITTCQEFVDLVSKDNILHTIAKQFNL